MEDKSKEIMGIIQEALTLNGFDISPLMYNADDLMPVVSVFVDTPDGTRVGYNVKLIDFAKQKELEKEKEDGRN